MSNIIPHVIRFNKSFQEVNECKKRYRVVMGGAGSGKSVNVAQDYILKLTEHTGGSLLCIRGVEVSHLNSTFSELTGAIDRMGLNELYKVRTNPLSIVNRANGNQVIFRGCNDQKAIDRLRSVTVPNGKIVHVWCEEATEIRQSDFDIIDDRLRGEIPEHLYYQITLTFNPISSRHWIKSSLWDYQSDDIFTHRTTYLDNRWIDTAYKARMARRKALDPEGYRVYGLGEWGETGGLIFPNTIIGDYQNREFDFYTMGTDYGFNHNHATLLIGWKDGEPYVIKEVVVSGKVTSEIIELCNDTKMPKNVIMYCDSAEPDRTKEFKRAGYRAYPVVKEKNSVANQIAWLKNRNIYIDGRCNNTHKELQSYTWKKCTTTGEWLDVPIEVNDDCVKALIYGCEPVRKAKGMKTMEKGRLGIW